MREQMQRSERGLKAFYFMLFMICAMSLWLAGQAAWGIVRFFWMGP